jgi:predicted permease
VTFRRNQEADVALNIASLCLILFAVLTIVLGIVKIHEYPSKVAEARNHPQQQAILACSLLGLLVFPLWMFALLWAYGGVIGQPLPATAAPATPGPANAPSGAAEADASAPRQD